MNAKLGMVILHFKDVAQARQFYTEKVGLTVVPYASDDHFVTLQTAGDAQIGLSGEPGDTGAGTTEIGFEVNDVDSVYNDWQSRGVNLLTQPNDFPFGRAFDASDPEGHRINIYKLKSMN